MNHLETRRILALVFSSKISDEQRNWLIKDMIESGDVTENDLAEVMINAIEDRAEYFRQLIGNDDLLSFLWERFRDRPAYLARALVRARPDLFYTYGFAFRLCIRLRADLGRVWIKPRPRGDGPDGKDSPIAQLSREVEDDIFALDLESTFREYLYYFSRDFASGMEILRNEMDRAKTAYDRKILAAVRLLAERLIGTRYPGVVMELNGNPFPALHVRWWLDQSKDQPRILNMGDTGSFKTAYAVIAARLMNCRRTLVVTAPHARKNWARELDLYFTEPPRVQVIESAHGADDLDPDADFVIAGYSQLVRSPVVDALIAHGFDGLIQDESHYGKSVGSANPAERATAMARLVRELPLRAYRALSATPWENRPEELASIALALRPELFTTPESFLGSGAANNPRLLRELFAERILEIELREVRDLPVITPRPWEDLFGAVPIRPNQAQREIYRLAYDDETDEPEPGQKALRLLMAAIHPPLLAERMTWNERIVELAADWRNSTKLEWIRRYIETRIATRKIVVGTGLYADGITRNDEEDRETPSVAALLREWFGEDAVIVLDGTVAITASEGEESPREAVIRLWRTDPEARILLVSMSACPDSVNLSIGWLPNVEGVSITALSYGWKPWKQFLGRFWREGSAVPVEYAVPVLTGTIDDDLLRMNREKWGAQQLFRALAPITDQERRYLGQDGSARLGDLLRDSVEHVNFLSSILRGRGERGARNVLDALHGATTRAEAFARHFLEAQNVSTWGDVANYMRKIIREWERVGAPKTDCILDAGCGPLTLERWLNAPVYGVDMNPHMIELGRQASPFQGQNARVGFLSELDPSWTGKFDLVAASLVLDYSSLEAESHGEPERLRILRELVRVCHPHGLVWLTWNESYQDEKTFKRWVKALEAEGFAMRSEIKGPVVAKDHPEKPCKFWSLAFSPNGRIPRFADPAAYRLPFEETRVKQKRGGKNGRRGPTPRIRVAHQHFEILTDDGALRDVDAARQAALAEVKRWANSEKCDRKLERGQAELARLITEHEGKNGWRILKRLHELGVITI